MLTAAPTMREHVGILTEAPTMLPHVGILTEASGRQGVRVNPDIRGLKWAYFQPPIVIIHGNP